MGLREALVSLGLYALGTLETRIDKFNNRIIHSGQEETFFASKSGARDVSMASSWTTVDTLEYVLY